MKEIIVNGKIRVWVTCPDCGKERLALKSNTKEIRFTGRCKKCYMVEARRNMGIYFPKG